MSKVRSKSRVHYLCRECGSAQSQWMGKCPDCGAWDALEKYHEPSQVASEARPDALVEVWRAAGAPGAPDDHARRSAEAVAVPLPEIAPADVARRSTGISEFDRVLGGGLVCGSVVLVGGDPGIGKSTLLLQAAARMAGPDNRVLYVSSEESAHQTKMRADRLFGADDASHLYVLAETNLARIVEQARRVDPDVLIIDSVQMIYRSDRDGAPGSIAQLRTCCQELVYLAKLSAMAVIVIGHVTKQGQIAGPKLIEHLVDTVLSFEGDRHHAHRVVRAMKNRFGTTLEVALFEMTAEGLREVETVALVHDPHAPPRPGSVLCPAMHGSRCLMIEVQALTAPGFLGNARRKVSGVDANRLAMLIAVLESHAGLRLADQDVFASTTGGLRVTDPGADCALALAVAGAHQRRALNHEDAVVAIGEVGLGGEIRRVASVEQRIREAARAGAKSILLPRAQVDNATSPSGARVVGVGTIMEAIEWLGPAAEGGGRGLRRAGAARPDVVIRKKV